MYKKNILKIICSNEIAHHLLLILIGIIIGISLIKFNLLLFLLFISIWLLLWFCSFKEYLSSKKELLYKIDSLQEKINLLKYEKERKEREIEILANRIDRYYKLRQVIDKISKDLDIDKTATSLVEIAFSLVGNSQSNCLLYLVDKELNLKLFKTKKNKTTSSIKTKKGDILDLWVLKYRSPLWIEDIRKDFRFDIEKIEQKDRYFESIISSPIISQHRFIGILRLEHFQHHFFDQDDLRLLCIIADLGATALENSELFTRIQELAIHDYLTGLYTRTYFLEQINKEFILSKGSFSLLMLDIDFFKTYNDKFGHTVGDIILKELAKIILKNLKQYSAIVSRFGGEEFCVALPQVNKENAFRIAEALRREIEEKKIILRQREIGITVSIGLASFPEDARFFEELIHKADIALYKAKDKGRNKVCSF